jgi:predicted amidophosphoribosyltransferase
VVGCTLIGVLTGLLDLVLPPRCAGCGAAEACCAQCLGVFGTPQRVRGINPATYALAEYQDAPRELVLAFKERGRVDLAERLGTLLGRALPGIRQARPDSGGTWWLVPAPSRRAASRRRGGAHILRLARVAARVLAADGTPVAVAPALTLAAGTHDSIGLDAAARRANLAGRVQLSSGGLPPPGTPVVLLDDVVTTGATAAACSRVLRTAGIRVTAVLALTSAAALKSW